MFLNLYMNLAPFPFQNRRDVVLKAANSCGRTDISYPAVERKIKNRVNIIYFI